MSSKNDSFIDEEIDYQTVSTGHSISIERPERLHEWLKAEDVEYIRHKFISHPLQKLNLRELRDVLDNLNIRFTDIEYNRLFLKINQNRDFLCDWNEFISYLIFGFQEDDPSTQKEALILPISTAPVIKKSEHRSPICSISLLRAQADEVDEDDEGGRQLNVALEDSPEACGMWITASREGQIRFWSNTLEPLRTSTSESIGLCSDDSRFYVNDLDLCSAKDCHFSNIPRICIGNVYAATTTTITVGSNCYRNDSNLYQDKGCHFSNMPHKDIC